MEKVLVSACLLGHPVRYDGAGAPSDHEILKTWLQEGRVVPFCPELKGGLAAPRMPVELRGGDGSKVLAGQAEAVGTAGEDLTKAFLAGAMAGLELCLRMDIRVAVFKEQSPSCGSSRVYDGSFSGRLVPGQGVASAVLTARGIRVFSEASWEEAQQHVAYLEQGVSEAVSRICCQTRS